jgi:Ca2+-binding RTX toxin-like protein
MAISAAMRTDIIELAVIANDAAPGQTLLAELVALADAGKSLTAIAEHLTARSAFTATYPTTQTANEFGVEWIANLLPEASAALQAECVVIVEAHINGGGSIASLLVSVQEFMSGASETDANLGALIANFNHKVEVATYHTITKEAAAEWSIPSTVTSTESTVATGKAAVDTALTPAAATPAPVATFALAADGTSVSEGGDVLFTLTTTNVAAGTEYSYVISGVNSADLSSGSLTGLAEVDSNGKATVSVGLKNDATTEGAETLTMTVAGETASVTVTDSSTTPAAATVATATYALASDVSTVSEGGDVVFTLTTTNVAAGTELAYVISGINSADLSSGNLTGLAEVDADGKATVSVGLKNDTTTEGAETLTMTLAGKTAAVSVTDSSTTPAAATASTYTLTSSAPSVTEGDSGTNNLVFTLTLDAAATTATTVNYETLTTGTATAGTDFDAAAGSVSFAIGATSATVSVTVNSDADFEASETVNVKFSGSDLAADVTGTGTITNDDTDPNTVAMAKTLTIGEDTITTGTAADTFNGSTASTLDTDDTLDGGDGSDTLSATFSAAESIRPNLTSIETVKLTANTTGQALTVDTRDISGTTLFTDESSAAAITLNNVAAVTSLTINSNTGDTANTARTVDYTDAAIAGASDNMTITLDNIDAQTVISLDDAGGTTNELETVTLNSIGLTNTLAGLTTANVETSKVVVTGDTDLTVTAALDNKVLTVDASAATGAVTVIAGTGNTTLTGGTGADSLTGGTGNDTITAGSGNSTLSGAGGNDIITGGAGNDIISDGTGNDIVDGGAGNDIITIGGGTDSITAGLGDDVIKIADSADIAATETVAGGDGADTLWVTAADTLLDASLTLATSIETIKGPAAAALTFAPDNLASDAGVTAITLGTAADIITLGANFTNDVTVTLGSTTADNIVDTVDASSYTGVLTVVAVGVALGDTSADILTGSTKLTDVLSFSGVVAALTTVTDFESYLVNADTTSTVTLLNANVADGDLLTIDGTAITTATKVLTVDLQLEANGQITVLGGAGPDVITGSISDLKDTLTGNAGNDTFKFTTGDLTAIDVISGGDGTDVINFITDATTAADAAFTLVTSVETIKSSNQLVSLTLDDKAQAAGIVTVTDSAATNDAITVLKDFTSNLTVNLATGNDTITANTTSDVYTGNLTVAYADAAGLTAADLIKGGSGTNSLSLTVQGASDTATLDDAIGIPTVTINDSSTAGEDITFVLTHTADSTLAYTIDASTLDAAVTGVGAASDETATITLSDANNKGTYTVTTGGGSDTVAMSAGTDNITTGIGNDTIEVGATLLTSADTISMGTSLAAGNDTLQVTGDETIVDADFTNVTGVEILTASASTKLIATLGTLAQAAGITKVALTDTAATDSVTVGAAFTNALTVSFIDNSAKKTVDASASAATITIVGTDADIEASTITGGTGLNDLISAGAGVYASNANMTGFEKITTTATGATSFTLHDDNIAADVTMTIDGTATTTGDLTVNAAAETDGNVTITAGSSGASIITLGQGNDSIVISGTGTGVATVVATDGANTITTVGGADIITMGGGQDTVSTGAGVDTITVTGAQLTSGDTILAGLGADILTFNGASTVIDSDFTNVTGLETLTETGANAALTITLGSKAAAAGVNAITATSAADTYTLGAAYTNNITITLSTGNDSIVGTNYTKVLTVVASSGDITSDDGAITGGTGTSDVFKFDDATTITGANFVDVTKFETLFLADADQVIAINDANNFTTIDASAHTAGSDSSFDGVLEDDTGVTYKDGAGITTFTGTLVADTIILKASDTVDDIIIVNDSTMDSVQNFETTASKDIVKLDMGQLETAGGVGIASVALDFVELFDNNTVAAGAFVMQNIADQDGGAAVASADGKSVFQLVGSTFASTSAVETALETGDYELSIAAGVDDKDAFVVIYSDGTNAYVASAHFVVNPGTDISSGDLVVTNLLEVTGVTAIANTTFVASNGAFLA